MTKPSGNTNVSGADTTSVLVLDEYRDKLKNIVDAKSTNEEIYNIIFTTILRMKTTNNDVRSKLNSLEPDEIQSILNDIKSIYDTIQSILIEKSHTSISIESPTGWLPAGSYTRDSLPPEPPEVMDLLKEINYIAPAITSQSKSTRLFIKSRQSTPFIWSKNSETKRS